MANDSVTANPLLGYASLVAFLPTTNPAKAKAFFGETLGLHLVSEEMPFALVFDANGTMLRVTVVNEMQPHPFTVLGWHVENIEETVEALTAKGVEFQRYPGMNDADPHGIWNAPSGARVAWFKDPEGNMLSLTEFPEKTP